MPHSPITITKIDADAGRYMTGDRTPTVRVHLSDGTMMDSLFLNHDRKRFGPLSVGQAIERNQYGTDRVGDYTESDAMLGA
jgi:hypothetical protein